MLALPTSNYCPLMDSARPFPVPEGFKLVEPQTDQDWAAYYELRWQILRAPWNQPRGSERDDLEPSAFHLMLKHRDGLPVAVGRLHFNPADEAQIRYMAVDQDYRGRGAGSRILNGLESHAVAHGAKTIVLNARDEALPFYLLHGYTVEGPADTLFGVIKHSRMWKQF